MEIATITETAHRELR